MKKIHHMYPFANRLVERPFVRGFNYSLSFGMALQMASPPQSSLQGHKNAVFRICPDKACLSLLFAL